MTLGEKARVLRGAIFVSLTAAKTYFEEVEDLSGIEAARRELTEIMLDANENNSDPTSYRARTRGLDISARVVREERLYVVVHIGIREDGRKGGAGARARRAERRKGLQR